jgi:hypothetical protein
MPETVSPELVLVDPELAERIRPIDITGAWTPAVRAAAIRGRTAPAPRASNEIEEGVVVIEEELRGPRRTPMLVTLGAAAAAGVAATAFVLHDDTRGSELAGDVAAGRALPTQTAVVTTQPAQNTAATTHRTRTAKAPTKRVAATRVRAHPLRVTWKRVKFATFYHVVFNRKGSRGLELWTPHASISLRLLRGGHGLNAGRYRWSVRPGYGSFRFRKLPGRTFYGPIVKRGVLVVPSRG